MTDRLRLRRRGLLGAMAAAAAAGGAALAGCGARGSAGHSSATGSPTAGASTPPTSPSPIGGDDADLAAAGAGLAEELDALVAATITSFGGLEADLAPLRETHAAHASALAVDGARTPAPAPTDLPSRRPVARALVVRRERAAATTYLDLATRSASGRLARLLAAAAAGLAQHLAALDPDGAPVLVAPEALPDGDASAATLEGLQTTLAAEHAAVWTLGVLGGRTSAADAGGVLDEITEAYGVHRARRDALAAAIRSDGAEPVAAAPAYERPDLGEGPDGRRAAVRRVEEACGATYAYLVAQTADERRDWALGALLDTADRQVRLGDDPVPLPGT